MLPWEPQLPLDICVGAVDVVVAGAALFRGTRAGAANVEREKDRPPGPALPAGRTWTGLKEGRFSLLRAYFSVGRSRQFLAVQRARRRGPKSAGSTRGDTSQRRYRCGPLGGHEPVRPIRTPQVVRRHSPGLPDLPSMRGIRTVRQYQCAQHPAAEAPGARARVSDTVKICCYSGVSQAGPQKRSGAF